MVARALVASALVLVLLSVPVSVESQATPPALRIVEILPDPTTGASEFIELWNPTEVSVELAGWRIGDEVTTPSKFTFPTWTLPAGGRIVVWSSSGAATNPAGPKWTTTDKWNNAGDAANLTAPDGTVVDYFAYGSGTGTPPLGFEDRTPQPAPAKGKSLALLDGAWVEADPTPGLAPGQAAPAGGGVQAEVVNVAPTPSFVDPPRAVRPGASVTLRVEVRDDNGDADVASWSVQDEAGTLASGSAAGVHEFTASAPASGPWVLGLAATDAGGLSTTVQATIEVRESPLGVQLPEGGLVRFPPLQPGDRGVVTLDAFRLTNDGDAPLRPRFDLSDLSGPTGTIPVAANLDVGVGPAGAEPTWVPYASAMTELPEMAPGAVVEVRLRILEVPVPLAAGSYGTSFTVVAA